MDIIGLYLKELKNEHSTKEESLELIQLARQGDSVAKEKVIKNYLLLVVKVARSYINMGVPLGELIAEGNAGLLNALEKFDAAKGAPFSTCAKFWIKQSIIRNCMHKKRIVRLPENVSELIRTDRWEGVQYREISIDSPNQDGDSLSDTIPETSPQVVFQSEEDLLMKQKVEKILSFLKKRDAEVVKACYGIGIEKPMEITEAAEAFKLTTTRINQILRNSLKKMRSSHVPTKAKSQKIEILSAEYGSDEASINVTEKVKNLLEKNETIKACNKLGGDPCPGTVKKLEIRYHLDGRLIVKTVLEGAFLKF